MAQTKKTRNKKYVPKGPSQRDTFLKEVEELKASCNGMLLCTVNVSELIKAADANPEINLDVPEVNRFANTLAKDVSALKVELDLISQEADNKIKTLTHTSDDLVVMDVTVSIANNYGQWQDRFTQITMPTVDSITRLCVGEEETSEEEVGENKDD